MLCSINNARNLWYAARNLKYKKKSRGENIQILFIMKKLKYFIKKPSKFYYSMKYGITGNLRMDIRISE